MLDSLSDSELLARVHDLGIEVSMYEAAEGQSYTRETPLRLAAKKAFWEALGLARERGLNPPTKDFLL